MKYLAIRYGLYRRYNIDVGDAFTSKKSQRSQKSCEHNDSEEPIEIIFSQTLSALNLWILTLVNF